MGKLEKEMLEFLVLIKTYFIEIWHDMLTLNEWAFLIKHPFLELFFVGICALLYILLIINHKKSHKKEKGV